MTLRRCKAVLTFKKTHRFLPVILICFAFILPVQIINAQTGYIYVHVQAINEDSVPTTGFPFTITGGPTTVSAFSLNDRPALVNNTSQDLGAGHGTGAGELWSVTGNILYHYLSATSTWISTQAVTGTTVTRVDGALAKQAVYISGTNAYFFNGVTNTTTLIYASTAHANVSVMDIAWGNGYIVITRGDGSIWKNNATSSYTDSWTSIFAANTTGTAANGLPAYIDINHSTNNIAFTRSTTSIDTANLSGTVLGSMTANSTDVAFADDGSLFSILNGTINKRIGTSWTADNTAPTTAKVITAGPGGQAWCITTWAYNPNTIYTRAVDGSGVVHWIDDERVRTTYDNNSIMIPVSPGTYTLTETRPTSWDILGETIYDPSNNSTTSPATNSASINVSAGEVVHVIMQNERLVPVVLQKQCAGAQMIENFGSAPSTASYVALPPLGITGYHYFSSTRFDDGYYSVANNSANWPNGSLIDHTTGTALGCYMLVNASFQQDEFYRKRVTNLVPGILYKINFWAASLSSGLNSIITVGVNDSNAVVLNTFSTPGFNGSSYYNWQSYSFTFTATTSQADIYLQNGGPGGGGNDLALDDISITPLATSITAFSAPSTLCLSSTATLTASPTGGVWSSGNTSVATIGSSSGVLQPVSAGSVSIDYTLTNAIGCITDTAVLITIYPKPTVIGSATKTTVCRSETINLNSTASGGTTPYASYAWTTTNGNFVGATNTTTATAVQPNAGSYNYTISVTDANGCVGSDIIAVTVTSNQSPVVSVSQSATTLCGTGQTVNLTSSISAGTTPYTYSWTASASGGGLNSPVNQSTASATPTQSGSYYYILNVTDAIGCKGSDSTAVIAASLGLGVTVSNTNPKLCNGQSLTVNSTPVGGVTPYTYTWTGSPSGANITSSTTIQNITAKPTVNGTYTYSVLVKDANNCSATASATAAIIVSASTPPTISASAASSSACNGQTTITLNATRTNSTTSPYNYVWTGSGLITSSYSSNFTSTSTTAKPTSTGTYTVTITDANNCSASATTGSVTVNPLPVVAPTANYISSNLCFGQNITLLSNPSGGTGSVSSWTYSWTQSLGGGIFITNTQNTTASPLLGGTYTYSVSATDTKGCTTSGTTGSVTVTVSSFGAPSVTASASATSVCSGQTSITLTANRTSSTRTNYTYVWSGSGITTSTYTNNNTPTTTTATPTASGVYTVNVTDGNNCTGTASTSTVTVNPVPAITASSNNKLCLGSTINLYSTPSGGTTPYTYLWTASSSPAGLQATSTRNSTAQPTATGTYSYNIQVTDNNGCTATASTGNVTVAPTLGITANASSTSVCTANNAITLTSTPTGGTSPYTYSWTGSSGSGLSSTTNTQNTSATPTSDGSSYAILVVDNNGCSASSVTSNVTVKTSPSITSSITVPSSPVCEGTAISLSSTASGGTGTYSGYLWTGSGINTGNQNLQNPTGVLPTSSGSYSVQVTDANGCTATSSTAAITVDAPSAVATLQCYSNYAELGEYGGSAVSWVWTASNPQALFRPNNTVRNPTTIYNGSYKVVITDAAGCKDSASILNAQGVCAILGVNLENFTATKQDASVLLKWKTSYELNNNYFDIERSSDGKNWLKIGTVKGMQNSANGYAYHFTDESPFAGKIYYRLKQVDNDGTLTYSPIATVVFTDNWRLVVYPNPMLDKNGQLQVKSNHFIKEIIVLDEKGGTAYTYRTKTNQENNLRVNLVQLAAGVYYLRIKDVNDGLKIIKIVR